MKSSLGWLLALAAAVFLAPSVAAEAAVANVSAQGIQADAKVPLDEAPSIQGLAPENVVDLTQLLEGAAERLPVENPAPAAPPAPEGHIQGRDVGEVIAAIIEPENAVTLAGLGLLLGALAHAGLFSRIQPNRMLENEVRGRVFEAIVQNPGITIKEIVAVCAIGWGTAVYHLERLEAERLIVSERNRQFRRFFKNGSAITNRSRAAFSELKSPTGQRIAERILASPGSCQKEVCAAVGISPPLAHKYLARLEAVGLVAAQREWKQVKYYPTPELQGLFATATSPPVHAAPAPLALVAAA